MIRHSDKFRYLRLEYMRAILFLLYTFNFYFKIILFGTISFQVSVWGIPRSLPWQSISSRLQYILVNRSTEPISWNKTNGFVWYFACAAYRYCKVKIDLGGLYYVVALNCFLQFNLIHFKESRCDLPTSILTCQRWFEMHTTALTTPYMIQMQKTDPDVPTYLLRMACRSISQFDAGAPYIGTEGNNWVQRHNPPRSI